MIPIALTVSEGLLGASLWIFGFILFALCCPRLH